jgi:hypothetical protein
MTPIPHSLKKGDSTYPVEAGTMFRLKKKMTIYNHKAKLTLEHEVFIWIQKYYKPHKKKKGDRVQRSKVRLWTCKLPLLPQHFHSHILTEQPINIETVIRRLHLYGYEVLKTGLPFHRLNRYDTRCYHVPYVIAGLVTETDIGKRG